ncbi:MULTISPECIES: hypothetical protein [Bifidobacterium]|uniref:Uncharacterized protein n=1 Tax=Bifidobacterium apousia TaxID=2750996 RepID=A0A556R1S6_9BIFI|nr:MULTISPECIES: hypothetical protein [Bifidobacterium]TSJ82787.1 hypothetical protein FPK30_06630 [Bifidobacterium apousia]
MPQHQSGHHELCTTRSDRLHKTDIFDRSVLSHVTVYDEAQGYMRFGVGYYKEKFQIPKMPPLREIMRQFL